MDEEETEQLLKGHSKPAKDETWNPKGKQCSQSSLTGRSKYVSLIHCICTMIMVILSVCQSVSHQSSPSLFFFCTCESCECETFTHTDWHDALHLYFLVHLLCKFFHQSWCFSAPVIAVSIKPCIVIVLDIPLKHAPWWGGLALFLAHLSRRLTRWAYRMAMIRRPSVVRPSSSVVRPQFQRSSPLKPLGQSKPNFMWSILRKGERKFI